MQSDIRTPVAMRAHVTLVSPTVVRVALYGVHTGRVGKFYGSRGTWNIIAQSLRARGDLVEETEEIAARDPRRPT